MSSRPVDLVIRRLAKEANLELSAHFLRHTFVTKLIRSVPTSSWWPSSTGHRRFDTTGRYSVPSPADKDPAVESFLVEICRPTLGDRG